MLLWRSLIFAMLFGLLATMTFGAENRKKGSITNQPIPRFVSQKFETMYVRRGPGYEYIIDWEYLRMGTPLRLTREFGQWRLVEDAEGIGGWVHQSQITGNRTAQVKEDTQMFLRRGLNMPLVAQVEKNAILRVLECDEIWCRLKSAGYKGWIQKSQLWGAIDIEK